MSELFSQITEQMIAFTGSFNIRLIVSISLLFITNEFGIFIPCLVETVWIMIGYHASEGSLTILEVTSLWITAISGRTIGMLLFYLLIRINSPWILKIYNKFVNTNLSQRIKSSNILHTNLLRRVNIYSPFIAALGRLSGLKIPFSITLSINKQLKNIMLALILSSVIHDFIYLLVGVIGSTIRLPSSLVILYSIIVLLIIYGFSLIIQKLFKVARARGT